MQAVSPIVEQGRGGSVMTRQVRIAAWWFGIGVVAAGYPWVSQRLTAQDDIPRYLRQSGPPRAGLAVETSSQPEPSSAPRLREGLALSNVVGSFQDVAGRIAFHPDDGRGPFLVLENLMRERVERLREETGDGTWIVSGVLTEYAGHNYLLLQRVVVKVDSPQKSPATPSLAAERS